MPAPVAKLMPSWQAPQASAVGFVLPVVAVLGLGRARRRARAVVARGAVADVLRVRGLGRQQRRRSRSSRGPGAARCGSCGCSSGSCRSSRPSTSRVSDVNVRDRAVRRERRFLLAVAALVGVADDAVLGLVAAAAVEARGELSASLSPGMPPSWRWQSSQLAIGDDLAREVGRGDLRAGRRNEVVDRVGRVLHRHRRDARRRRRSACSLPVAGASARERDRQRGASGLGL